MLRAVPATRAIKGSLPASPPRRKPKIARASTLRRVAAPATHDSAAESYDLANAAILAAALGTGVYVDTFI